MRVGIVGLGLMGASAARRYKQAGWQVLAYNRSQKTLEKAISEKVVDAPLDEASLATCDLVILANPLDASIAYLEKNAKFFRNTVVDFCGVKEKICDVGFELSKKYSFTYFGTHPMCGTNKSGYDNSFATLYEGAPIAICVGGNDNVALAKLKELLSPLMLKDYILCTPAEHDRIIACTSQMAHCITSTFVKTPTAQKTLGIKSGGFCDMSRLASLVPSMWAELMVSNKKNLTSELDIFIKNLKTLRRAIRLGNIEKVEMILENGRKAKEAIDSGE